MRKEPFASFAHIEPTMTSIFFLQNSKFGEKRVILSSVEFFLSGVSVVKFMNVIYKLRKKIVLKKITIHRTIKIVFTEIVCKLRT